MVETFQKYSGSGLIISWFLVALVYLFFQEKEKDKRILFVYVPSVVLLLIFNPLFFRIFSRVTEEGIYFRMFWLLPVTVVIGYSAVKVWESLGGWKRVSFGILAALLIMLSGKWVYSNPLFGKAENLYHVPQEVVELCDTIKIEGREIMAAFPEEFLLYVRQYSPYVCMPYGRSDTMGSYSEFRSLMREEDIPAEELAKQAKKNGCHYVILSENKNIIGDMTDYDYELFDQVGEYLIYKDVTMNFDTVLSSG